MEEKKRLAFSELKVGIFVITALAVLALAIFTIGTQVGLFEETFRAKTYLNNVSGLKPGDIVLLGGVEVGNVTRVDILEPDEPTPPTEQNIQRQAQITILEDEVGDVQQNLEASRRQLDEVRREYEAAVNQQGINTAPTRAARHKLDDQEQLASDLADHLADTRADLQRAKDQLQNIVVEMEIKANQRKWIRKDSSISLGSVGLLGDKYIEIALGRGSEEPEIEIDEVDTWFGTKTEEVVLITGKTQAGFQELITGANDILANFGTLSEKLQDVFDKFEQGEGTVGKFFNDPSFYNNLNDTVLGAREAVETATKALTDITKGEGTIPQLIQQRELYDKINDSVTRLDQMVSSIQAGQGTVGKIVSDPALYDKADQAMGSIREITRRIDAGEGTLGKLSADDQLYVKMQDTLSQLAGFATDVEQGKGTLGRLAKDEQLYQNLNEVSSEVVKLLYDFRQNPKKFLTIKFEIF